MRTLVSAMYSTQRWEESFESRDIYFQGEESFKSTCSLNLSFYRTWWKLTLNSSWEFLTNSPRIIRQFVSLMITIRWYFNDSFRKIFELLYARWLICILALSSILTAPFWCIQTNGLRYRIRSMYFIIESHLYFILF